MRAPGSHSTRPSRSWNTSREPRLMYAREGSTSHASTQTSQPRSLKRTRSEDSRRRNVNRSSRKRPGASPVKDALVDPMEHSAHRGRRHPVEVTEVGGPRGCLDLETTEVPLLRIYDGGPLGQGAQGHPTGELPSNRREGRGRRGEHRADECIAPIPESSLHQLEEFGAGVDGDPGGFGDLP